jgi:hypothetical protein
MKKNRIPVLIHPAVKNYFYPVKLGKAHRRIMTKKIPEFTFPEC